MLTIALLMTPKDRSLRPGLKGAVYGASGQPRMPTSSDQNQNVLKKTSVCACVRTLMQTKTCYMAGESARLKENFSLAFAQGCVCTPCIKMYFSTSNLFLIEIVDGKKQ